MVLYSNKDKVGEREKIRRIWNVNKDNEKKEAYCTIGNTSQIQYQILYNNTYFSYK